MPPRIRSWLVLALAAVFMGATLLLRVYHATSDEQTGASSTVALAVQRDGLGRRTIAEQPGFAVPVAIHTMKPLYLPTPSSEADPREPSSSDSSGDKEKLERELLDLTEGIEGLYLHEIDCSPEPCVASFVDTGKGNLMKLLLAADEAGISFVNDVMSYPLPDNGGESAMIHQMVFSDTDDFGERAEATHQRRLKQLLSQMAQ